MPRLTLGRAWEGLNLSARLMLGSGAALLVASALETDDTEIHGLPCVQKPG